MASKHQIQCLTEDAICPICLDFFTDPVTLECGHNFCRSCITQSWDKEGRNSCPVCREDIADRTLKGNRALASITETARALSLNTGGKESKLHCEEHQEELKLFCETDKKLVCLICRDAREHKSHSFMPIKEAVERYKEQIKTSLEILTKNKSAVGDMEQQQKAKISGVREQSQNLFTCITSVFAELRQILNEKERLFLKDLREDEESVLNPMENNLRAIQEEINSIQEKLLKLQERMNQTDSLIFLKEETRQKRRISDEEHTLSVADGALAVGKYDHPFLLNTVFSEVPDNIKRGLHTAALCGTRTSATVGSVTTVPMGGMVRFPVQPHSHEKIRLSMWRVHSDLPIMDGKSYSPESPSWITPSYRDRVRFRLDGAIELSAVGPGDQGTYEIETNYYGRNHDVVHFELRVVGE
ncbi:nuclear factor 7, brain-like [Rhinoraja longicauda]